MHKFRFYELVKPINRNKITNKFRYTVTKNKTHVTKAKKKQIEIFVSECVNRENRYMRGWWIEKFRLVCLYGSVNIYITVRTHFQCSFDCFAVQPSSVSHTLLHSNNNKKTFSFFSSVFTFIQHHRRGLISIDQTDVVEYNQFVCPVWNIFQSSIQNNSYDYVGAQLWNSLFSLRTWKIKTLLNQSNPNIYSLSVDRSVSKIRPVYTNFSAGFALHKGVYQRFSIRRCWHNRKLYQIDDVQQKRFPFR